MQQNKRFWILLVVFVLLLVGASVLYAVLAPSAAPEPLLVEPTKSTDPEATDPQPILAPDFTVYDAQGNPHSLSDFRGKPVIVNFWASWCYPCQSEMPDFQEKYEQYGDQIHFLMVNMTDGQRETVATASGFIEGKGYSFPVYYDTAASAAITYGIYSLPTSYFYDAQGQIIAQASGAIDGQTLQRGIDLILPQP